MNPPAGAPRPNSFDAERRCVALTRDASASNELPLDGLWLAIAQGAHRIEDHFCTTERSVVILGAARVRTRSDVLTVREREVFERIALGDGEKVIAFENRIAISTVSSRLRSGLRKLRLHPGSARMPLFLCAAIHAARHRTSERLARVGSFDVDGARYTVASIPRPDAELPFLAPAERDVARHFIEGFDYAQIAALRGTSVRTVANQLCRVFQKIGASGRNRVIAELLARGAGLGGRSAA